MTINDGAAISDGAAGGRAAPLRFPRHRLYFLSDFYGQIVEPLAVDVSRKRVGRQLRRVGGVGQSLKSSSE